MPRFAWLLLAACSINADYSKAKLRDAPGSATDARVDSTHDATAHVPALTCADPGDPLANNGSNQGTTSTSTNEVSGSCGASVYNGPDNIYALTGPRTVTISITGSYMVAAYVTTTCTNLPPPSCEGGSAAPPSFTISLGAGMHYIIVDGVNAGLSGSYRLLVQ